jgi:hypothetical protein
MAHDNDRQATGPSLKTDAAIKQPDEPVREVIYPVASETLLRDLIKEYESKGPVFRRQVHLVMRASYRSHYRRGVFLGQGV